MLDEEAMPLLGMRIIYPHFIDRAFALENTKSRVCHCLLSEIQLTSVFL